MRPPRARPPARRRFPGLLWAVAAGVVACAAVAVWRPWRGRAASAAKTPVALASAATAAVVPPAPQRPFRGMGRESVAVLAFANVGGEKENEYFSDGISEDLINVLARVPGLKVAARTSAFYFKGKQVPIADIARQIGVAFVVEGSVQKAGSRVRVTAQLVNAADGFQVWSDSFDRELKDIFALQDEIAGLVAQNLRLKIGNLSLPAKATIDPEAFQLFLAGRDRAERAGSADLKAAIDCFQRAIALEPNYAAAWAAMARANIQLARWGGIETGAGYAEARKAVDRAAALEPDSPGVLVAQGWVRRTADWDWKGARQAFQRALEVEPNNPEILADAAILFFNIGQTDVGIQYARRAVDLDPLNAATNVNLCLLFQFTGELKKAEQAIRRALQLAPAGQRYHGSLAVILSELGRPAEARQEAALETDVISQKAAYAFIAAKRGAKEKALALARQIEDLAPEKGGTADIYSYAAEIYSRLNEKDRAFAALGHAFDGHDPGIAWIKVDTTLGNLHGDPRWAELLTKTGLADDQLR